MSITVAPSAKRVVIHEDIPSAAVAGLGELIERYYFTPNMRYVDKTSYRRSEFQGSLEYSWKFNLLESGKEASLSIRLLISQPSVELNFDDLDSSDALQLKLCSRVVDDIQNIVWSYFQNIKMSSLYFVIGERYHKEQSEAPNQGGVAKNEAFKKLFSGNTANVFLTFMLVSFVLFFIIGIYTVFVIIVFQLIYLIFSDKIALSMGNVHPTKENPLVTIVSVRSTPETLKDLRTYGRRILPEVRDQVTKSVNIPTTIVERNQVKSMILQILSKQGIQASMNDIEIKTRNLFSMVERVSMKFHREPPKIVIQNSVVSNAASTGISTNHSSIMITAGSLEDLNEAELESTIGHELGHIKGHDPVILFAVTAFLYPLLIIFGLLFFILAFATTFAIGKVLETRADTESAIIVGNPGSMASSLTKMGMRQLYHEKYSPASKILDWFQFDPHPPIYFRVARLSEFATEEERMKTKHAFLVSLRDCVIGFFSAF